MPYRSRRTRSRSITRLVTAAVVGAVVVGGASTATAFALDAQRAIPTAFGTKVAIARTTAAATAPASSSSRAATSVHGWAAASTSVRGGRTYRALALVSGEHRTVRLERLVKGGWKVLDADRTSRNGAAALSWKAPNAAARTCGSTAYPAVAALQRSTALDTAAGDYALKMGREGFFDHVSPDGSTMVSRLKAVGISGVAERENIAAGQTSADSVMAGWLKSPGHCANLMAADVQRIGLGHASVPGSPYTQYWVQDFAG